MVHTEVSRVRRGEGVGEGGGGEVGCQGWRCMEIVASVAFLEECQRQRVLPRVGRRQDLEGGEVREEVGADRRERGAR